MMKSHDTPLVYVDNPNIKLAVDALVEDTKRNECSHKYVASHRTNKGGTLIRHCIICGQTTSST